MFRPLLLTTGRPADGSVLVCVFDHTLGDAATFGIFMKAWSDAYRSIALAGHLRRMFALGLLLCVIDGIACHNCHPAVTKPHKTNQWDGLDEINTVLWLRKWVIV